MPAKCSAQHTDASTGEIARQGFPFNLYIWQTLVRVGLRSLMQLFFWACWSWLIIFSLSLKVHGFKELLFFSALLKGPIFQLIILVLWTSAFLQFCYSPPPHPPPDDEPMSFNEMLYHIQKRFLEGRGCLIFFCFAFLHQTLAKVDLAHDVLDN